MKKTVCIFTTFTSADPAYSLNRVVQDQIRMLVDHDYEPTVIVAKGFDPIEMYAHPKVTIKEIPSVPCHNEVRMDNSFNQDVRSLEGAIEKILDGIDIVITHDVVYQPACLKHLVASKRIAKRHTDIRWLHWIHSATSPYLLANLAQTFTDEYAKEVRDPFPSSYYVYFNDFAVPSVAQAFGISEDIVRVVHHPTDYCRFNKFEPETIELVRKKDLLSADAIALYPARLDRGKQVEFMIKIMGQLKTLKTSVRAIVVDFHSTGGDKVTYRDELKQMAIDWGLNEKEMIFTSEFSKEWGLNVPYQVVGDLMRIANIVIQPSRSESYSLVAQEGGLSGNVLMLNQDFPPMRDIYGKYPFYRKFSSNMDLLSGVMDENSATDTKYDNEYGYMLSCAASIKAELQSNRILGMQTFLRKYRNPDYVFRNELEPLFYEELLKEKK